MMMMMMIQDITDPNLGNWFSLANTVLILGISYKANKMFNAYVFKLDLMWLDYCQRKRIDKANGDSMFGQEIQKSV
jgi:hypothetical protein